jgi:cold shock CspA family protein
MTTGQVKLFNRQGGYGVIEADEGSDVVFFRARSCAVSPRVGDRVTYGVRLNPKNGQREAVEITAAGGGVTADANRTCV